MSMVPKKLRGQTFASQDIDEETMKEDINKYNPVTSLESEVKQANRASEIKKQNPLPKRDKPDRYSGEDVMSKEYVRRVDALRAEHLPEKENNRKLKQILPGVPGETDKTNGVRPGSKKKKY